MSTQFRGFSTVDKIRAPYTLTNQDLIKRDLLNTLYTRKGERVMRPGYGTIIWDLLMDPVDATTEQMIKDDLTRIIKREPRVDLVDIQIFVLDRSVRADITLRYIPYNTTDVLYLNYVSDIESGNE